MARDGGRAALWEAPAAGRRSACGLSGACSSAVGRAPLLKELGQRGGAVQCQHDPLGGVGGRQDLVQPLVQELVEVGLGVGLSHHHVQRGGQVDVDVVHALVFRQRGERMGVPLLDPSREARYSHFDAEGARALTDYGACGSYALKASVPSSPPVVSAEFPQQSGLELPPKERASGQQMAPWLASGPASWQQGPAAWSLSRGASFP